LLLFASPAPGQDLHQYDPFAYDPWFDSQPANPFDGYAAEEQHRWDRMQQEWERQDRRTQERQDRYDDMMESLRPPRDPLVDYYQRRDEERSHSLSACMGIHSNYAAQQACLERIR